MPAGYYILARWPTYEVYPVIHPLKPTVMTLHLTLPALSLPRIDWTAAWQLWASRRACRGLGRLWVTAPSA